MDCRKKHRPEAPRPSACELRIILRRDLRTIDFTSLTTVMGFCRWLVSFFFFEPAFLSAAPVEKREGTYGRGAGTGGDGESYKFVGEGRERQVERYLQDVM